MAFGLVIEDGSGKGDANCYVGREDANAYFEGRLAAEAWSAATDATKDRALAMATRIIDAVFQFGGWKANQSQALAWPRYDCPDLGSSGASGILGQEYLAANSVPRCVWDATCELGLTLLAEDRTLDAFGAGMQSLDVAQAVKIVFDPLRPKPIVSKYVQALLSRVGQYVGAGNCVVKLARA